MDKLKFDLQMFNGYRGQDLSYLKVGSDTLTNTKGDATIAITNPEIDTSDDSSNGSEEFLLGNQSAVITATVNYQKEADAAAAQLALIDAAYAKTELTYEWAYETGVGIRNWTGSGKVTSHGSTNGDPQTMTFTIKINGGATQGTQA